MTNFLSRLFWVTVMAASLPASATELVYRPINPAFGGDPLNGTYLLNNANAQNKKKDPDASSALGAAGQPQTAVEQFSSNLQRAILSRIASAVSGSLFDATGDLIPGTVETASFSITITDLGSGVLQIATLDKVTGQSTVFEITQ